MIYNVVFDHKLKANVPDSKTFRISDYDLDITEKMIDDETPIQRIIFSKSYK